ncbi:MAG: phosphoribosyltransferase family protein, partial [Bacteroidales bacterium]
MDRIKVLDKTFVRFIDREQIHQVVARLAGEIDRDHGDEDPLFLSVLNGSFMFASDLFKELRRPCRISFVKMASYLGTGSTGQVHQLIGLQEKIAGQTVIILEDIVDSGLTIAKLLDHVRSLHPAKVLIASLLFKPDAFKANFQIDYLGMSIPNDFVVGYGLDYDGYGRNYGELYRL